MTLDEPPSAACCGVARTEAVEDYLKTVFALWSQEGRATVGAIAARLRVTAPSASAMVKRLAGSGLLDRRPDRTVALTDHGREHALAVVRRHRLLETFLSRTLGMPWDEVHAEAEVLEHVVSDRLTERIAEALGHPTHDPHGDPIPPPSGEHREEWQESLDSAPQGARFRVERVSDRDSAALRHLADLGITPGARLLVEGRDPFGGPLWVRVGDAPRPLGSGLTGLVHGTVERGGG